MLNLPVNELVLFVGAGLLYLGAAVLGAVQIGGRGERYRMILNDLIGLAVVLEIGLLVFRSIALGRVALTGLFESMIALTGLFGVFYLVLGLFIRQVWFGSVTGWVILSMMVLTAAVAETARTPQVVATKPWVVVHALAMIGGAALILMSAVSAVVYLVGRRRLKRKEIHKVIGRMPNLQKLERLNLGTLRAAFVLVTIGMVSGVVGVWLEAELLGGAPLAWLLDSKVLSVLITWGLLGGVMVLQKLRRIRRKRVAYATLAVLLWIVFALVGSRLLCATKHDFSEGQAGVTTNSRE